jgi:hypothetical protein
MYKISIILIFSLCFNFLFSEENDAKDKNLPNIEDFNSIKPNYDPGQTEYNPNINPQSDSRDTPVEVYFCTDSWANESSFNICGASGCVWTPDYQAGWIGNNTCHSQNMSLADGSYTLTVYDTYGDGGIVVSVLGDGGVYVTAQCEAGSTGECGSEDFTIGVVESSEPHSPVEPASHWAVT